jgi:predicted N-acetyltransferase YhbS
MATPTYHLRPQSEDDAAAIEQLNARAFGPGRYARSAYRLREEVGPDLNLSYVACVGSLLVGANQMTPIRCGEHDALLLGPLTVDPAFQKAGIGEALALASMEAARSAGHHLVLLVGDLPYYQRLGFQRVPDGQLVFCGPVDPDRLLFCELTPGSFDRVTGKVRRAAERN